MKMEIYKCLGELESLPPLELHGINQRYRGRLASSEWWLSVSLLASERGRLHRNLETKYPDVIAYAESELHLSREKTLELLSTARAFERLPKLSKAFADGKLSWGKVRELKRVATPETDQVWCDYALSHSLAEVRRRVAMSPTEWKRGRALAASLEGEPTATTVKVQEVLETPVEVAAAPAEAVEAVEPGSEPDAPVVLPQPRFIKVVHYLTPDEFAVYEQARKRVCSRRNRCLRKEAVLLEWSNAELSGGDARARARHQVLIHTSGDEAWYETERGLLPADPEVVKETRQAGREIELVEPSVGKGDPQVSTSAGKSEPRDVTSTGNQRGYISNENLRFIFARAGNRCECCGRSGCQLDGHHRVASSDGGGDNPENLLVLCKLCHALMHEADFELRLDWFRARAQALMRAGNAEMVAPGGDRGG